MAKKRRAATHPNGPEGGTVSGTTKPKLLIVGAAGVLASLAAKRFADHWQITGIDARPLVNAHAFAGEFIQVGYTKRKVAEVFRQGGFDALLHLGRISTSSAASDDTRFRENVLGTRNLLALALAYRIKTVVVVSTHLVYGAHKSNHLYIRADEPLRASQTFRELADAVELDHEAHTFALAHRAELRTVVLRPTHIIGPRIRNAMAAVLRNRYCPMILGFDPLMQFLHEDDLVEALAVTLAAPAAHGVFNVAGEGVIPYSAAISLAGCIPLPLPEPLLRGTAKLLPLIGRHLPAHLVEYIKFPTIVADDDFRKTTGYSPRHTTVDLLSALGRP
jgi:UDP-glucose 4-epimerase